MTKEQIRNLPHKYGRIINLQGESPVTELTIDYGQAQYKLKSHGALYSLPYTVNLG
jgi:hypothetical protein